MIFQEQLNDFPDTYSRNYEDCQPVAGKRQQKISERETIQIFSVGELKKKAVFQSEQKVILKRWSDLLLPQEIYRGKMVS